MWLGRRRVPVSFPDEPGVRRAFIEIVLDDAYGVGRRPAPISTVLDVGAHVGLFCLAAHKIHPSATIHAYEPNVALEPHLRVQLAATNAVWYCEALGSGGRGSLIVKPGETVRTKVVPDSAGSVPFVPLSVAIERAGRVDLAKIDCEGGEWSLLDEESPWRSIRELAIEIHRTGDLGVEAALGRLRELGFAPWHVARRPWGDGVVLASRVAH
jgi:FkbM family methyltransferase